VHTKDRVWEFWAEDSGSRLQWMAIVAELYRVAISFPIRHGVCLIYRVEFVTMYFCAQDFVSMSLGLALLF
jgi:hypothetical protein